MKRIKNYMTVLVGSLVLVSLGSPETYRHR
jgi:hypothetical protein